MSCGNKIVSNCYLEVTLQVAVSTAGTIMGVKKKTSLFTINIQYERIFFSDAIYRNSDDAAYDDCNAIYRNFGLVGMCTNQVNCSHFLITCIRVDVVCMLSRALGCMLSVCYQVH